jgi:hypothetical protein
MTCSRSPGPARPRRTQLNCFLISRPRLGSAAARHYLPKSSRFFVFEEVARAEPRRRVPRRAPRFRGTVSPRRAPQAPTPHEVRSTMHEPKQRQTRPSSPKRAQIAANKTKQAQITSRPDRDISMLCRTRRLFSRFRRRVRREGAAPARPKRRSRKSHSTSMKFRIQF